MKHEVSKLSKGNKQKTATLLSWSVCQRLSFLDEPLRTDAKSIKV